MNNQQINIGQSNTVSIIELPWLFRVVHLDRVNLPKGGYRFQATLFHEIGRASCRERV